MTDDHMTRERRFFEQAWKVLETALTDSAETLSETAPSLARSAIRWLRLAANAKEATFKTITGTAAFRQALEAYQGGLVELLMARSLLAPVSRYMGLAIEAGGL